MWGDMYPKTMSMLIAYWTRIACGNRHRDFLFCPRGGASDMSVDKLRPEANLLSALMIVGAGLPMAVAIIWVCS
jgi:hypothetical protein